MRQKLPNKRPLVALFAAMLLIFSAISSNALAATAGGAESSSSASASASTLPNPPSAPNTNTCGVVSFVNVPAGWYLIVEPGDILVTSGFDWITLTPGDYSYEFRDAGGNDQVGGKFTVNACPSETPSSTASETPSSTPSETPSCQPIFVTGLAANVSLQTACPTPSETPSETSSAMPSTSRLPSPSAMPDTATGPGGSDGGGAMAIVILGLALFFSGLGYTLVHRRGLIGPRSLS